MKDFRGSHLKCGTWRALKDSCVPCAGATAGCQHLPGCSGGTEPSGGPFVEFTAAVMGWRGACSSLWCKTSSLWHCWLCGTGGGPGNRPDGDNASVVTAV